MASQTESFEGPLALTEENISALQAKTENYRLGKSLNTQGGLIVDYVGRSDTDITERLTFWLNSGRGYTYFRYKYATSPRAAFYQECQDYHKFAPPDNAIHPDRPAWTNWECPVCHQ